MSIDTNHQRRFLGQWPGGCANLVANIIGRERQFDSRQPSSTNRLFANFLNRIISFMATSHQLAMRSILISILGSAISNVSQPLAA
jgi:hypothetical protein